MPTHLSGKKVVITGGNRGIGRAIALAFAKQGSDIVITYNSDPQAAQLVVKEMQNFGIKAKAIKVNLLDAQDRSRLVKECAEFLGEIDVLVNNAGVLTRNSFLKLSEQEVNQVMSVNVLGPFFLSQTVGQYMVDKQKTLTLSNQELTDRCIINITSLSRKVVTPGLSHYEMSKAAVSQLTKSMAMDEDFTQYKIRVNDVAPGLVPTDINRKQWQANSSIWQKRVAGIPLARTGKPEEIAQMVIAVASNEWMTGSTITIDGGRTRNWSGAEITPDQPSMLQSKL